MPILVMPAPVAEDTAMPTGDTAVIAKLEHYIDHPPQNSRVFTVTPTVAQHILDNYNVENRSKKPSNIKRYADDMVNDRWPVTGDTLKFSDRKLFRDGQNRLLGCIAAEVPFTTHVVFGIPDAAFQLLDRGKNRDGADVLGIAQVQNAGQVSAAIKWAVRIENGGTDRATLEPHQILSLYRANYEAGGIQDRVAEAREIYVATHHPIGPVGGLLWHFYASDPCKAAQFARSWAARGIVKRGVQGKQLEVMIKALDALKSASSGRIHDTVRAAWAVIAWNAFKAGRRVNVRSFAWNPSTDDFPEID